MLITDSYRELNALLHRTNPAYGTSGKRYADIVQQLCDRLNTKDVLDYGCGKRTLEQALGFEIFNYDPCIPGLDKVPGPHDIVACTDVLEHIEPDCLDEVLEDIRRCARRVAMLLVATRPAVKYLADGRNAHLIQQPFDWWKASIEEAGFSIRQKYEMPGEFLVVCD